MTEAIFGILESIGFTHPLHPALTHIPMGMVMGCFFLGLAALVTGKTGFLKSALHCSVIAIIFIVPTAAAGFLDWQHIYGSAVSVYIVVKIILAVVLTVLLAVSIFVNMRGGTTKQLFIIYLLCLACAGGLGFSGGEIIYGG